MNLSLKYLVFETTRRCNLCCNDYCLRGPAQNIDLSKEIVDTFFEQNNLKRIIEIVFTGGEPTIQPEIIIYIIDKIIKENRNVANIRMVTNGQIFNQELIKAFNRFNEYANQWKIDYIKSLYYCEFEKDTINLNLNKNARIIFSTDSHHEKIKEEIKELYYTYGKNITFSEFNAEESGLVIKSGFSQTGRDYTYQLKPLLYSENLEEITVTTPIYITATGFITSDSEGTYTEEDNLNMGHVMNESLIKTLVKYGKPMYSNTLKLTLENTQERKR